MKFDEFIGRFIMIRKCAGCGELLPYEARADAFCPDCRAKWDAAKASECPVCAKAAVECDCMPKALAKAGVATLKKLVPYRASESSSPSNKILYYIKHNKNPRVTHFIADELSHRVYEIMRQTGAAAEDTVITNVPRSRKAIIKYGFDQSRLIAEELATLTGTRFLPLIVRRGGKEQKKLNASSRAGNVAGKFLPSFEFAKQADGKLIIIFDDIVTTGSSMAECAAAIRSPNRIIICGLSVAMTQ